MTGLDLVGEADNAQDAVRLVVDLRPDGVLRRFAVARDRAAEETTVERIVFTRGDRRHHPAPRVHNQGHKRGRDRQRGSEPVSVRGRYESVVVSPDRVDRTVVLHPAAMEGMAGAVRLHGRSCYLAHPVGEFTAAAGHALDQVATGRLWLGTILAYDAVTTRLFESAIGSVAWKRWHTWRRCLSAKRPSRRPKPAGASSTSAPSVSRRPPPRSLSGHLPKNTLTLERQPAALGCVLVASRGRMAATRRLPRPCHARFQPASQDELRGPNRGELRVPLGPITPNSVSLRRRLGLPARRSELAQVARPSTGGAAR